MSDNGNRILVEEVNGEPNFVKHEKFEWNYGEGSHYDVAVLKLVEDLPLDSAAPTVAVNAVCLPDYDEIAGELVTTGWGQMTVTFLLKSFKSNVNI